MDNIVLDEIPFDPDMETLAEWFSLKPESPRLGAFNHMLDAARAVARPKAVYRVARVDDRGADYVVLDGTTLASRVLSVNLEDAHRAFVYVATCGVELDEWAQSIDDPFGRFQAGAIAGAALMAARHALFDHIQQIYQPGRVSEMNPGSLPDWPIRQQRPLFELLGDPEAAIGVRLLDSCLMDPTKSTSGLLFPAEHEYYNCQLCPMDNCPGRRAPYQPELYERKYRPEGPSAK